MLGILRYLLAVMVVLSHLWYDLMWWQGAYAVFCFYLISGYLMCLVINQTYTGPGGIARYALNRILRIYPIYLLVFALSIMVTIGFETALEQPLGNGLTFARVMPLPASFGDWVANLTLLYLPSGNTFNVSPAWSLRVELFFYAAMLVLTRRLWLVVAWLGASILYAVWMEHQGTTFIDRYTSIFGASIAFSIGASVYYLRQFKRIPDWHIPIASTAMSCWGPTCCMPLFPVSEKIPLHNGLGLSPVISPTPFFCCIGSQGPSPCEPEFHLKTSPSISLPSSWQ
jgi:peptidoglycan/LPS O-acetylase OafA/YrhL